MGSDLPFSELWVLAVAVLPSAWLLVQLVDKLHEIAYRRLQMRQARLDIEDREKRHKPKRFPRM